MIFVTLSNIQPMHIQEKRREDEEIQAQLDMQLAQEAAHAKIARDISNEVLQYFTFIQKFSNSKIN